MSICAFTPEKPVTSEPVRAWLAASDAAATVEDKNAGVPQRNFSGLTIGETGNHVRMIVETMIKRSAKPSYRRGFDIRGNLTQYLRLQGCKRAAGVLAATFRRAYNILHGQVDESPQTLGSNDCWGPWLVVWGHGKVAQVKAWVDRELLTIAKSAQWCYRYVNRESSFDDSSLFALHFVLSRYDKGLAEDLLISLFREGGKQDIPHRDVLRQAINRINSAMRSVPVASKKRRTPTAEMSLFLTALVIRVFFAELRGETPDLRFDPVTDAFPRVPPCDGADD